MVEALVAAGDAQPGGVVVGAEVQPGAAPGRGVHHGGDGRRPVGQQHGLRRLHLDLEPQRTLGQPVRALQPLADVDHGRDLGDRGDLGQRDHPAGGQLGPLQQGPEHQVQGPQPAPPGRRLEGLAADAEERRRRPGAHRGRQLQPDHRGVPVLLVVRPGAVAVLQVDPQVLDRLAPQLLAYGGPDRPHGVDVQPGDPRHVLRPRGVAAQGGGRRPRPTPRRPRRGTGRRGRRRCAPAAGSSPSPGMPAPAPHRQRPAAGRWPPGPRR